MRKIFKDTLQSPSGKWSRKSLTMFVSFQISILLGVYIVASDYILDKEINRYAVDVFHSFMLLVGALSGITVADKFTTNKDKKEED